MDLKMIHSQFLITFQELMKDPEHNISQRIDLVKGFLRLLPNNEDFIKLFNERIRHESVPPFTDLSSYEIVVEVPFKTSHHKDDRRNWQSNFDPNVTIGVSLKNEYPLFPVRKYAPINALRQSLLKQRVQYGHSSKSKRAAVLRIDGTLLLFPKMHLSLFQFSLGSGLPFSYFNAVPLTQDERKLFNAPSPVSPTLIPPSFLDNSL